MLARISSSELTEWMIIYGQNPWGGWRGDLNAGIIASTVCNVMGGKRSKMARPIDFMPNFDKPKRKTPAEMFKTMQAFAAHQNQKKRKKP